jgi:hypothetical protein
MPRFDSFVKKPLDVFEYTADHVKELQKCSEDFWYFIKYVKIVHPDKGRIPFEPYPFQKEILNTVLDERFSVILCPRQVGKCVSHNSMISLRNKKTDQIEDIAIGDLYKKVSNERLQS